VRGRFCEGRETGTEQRAKKKTMKPQKKNKKRSGLQSRPEQVGKEAEKAFQNTKSELHSVSPITERVLAALFRWMPKHFEKAEVIGEWVWIQRIETPCDERNQELLDLGFQWVPDRQIWLHPCGNLIAGQIVSKQNILATRALARIKAK
jgi:hypothetical protein